MCVWVLTVFFLSTQSSAHKHCMLPLGRIPTVGQFTQRTRRARGLYKPWMGELVLDRTEGLYKGPVYNKEGVSVN